MADIICISCWSSFDTDKAESAGDGMLTCPHCGFLQPAPATVGDSGPSTVASAATIPELAAIPEDVAAAAASQGIGLSGGFSEDDGADSTLQDQPAADDAIVDSVLAEALADAAGVPPVEAIPDDDDDEEEDDLPPIDPDKLWFVSTDTGLRLTFPTFDTLARWANKRTAGDMQVTHGREGWRAYGDFKEKLRRNDNPIEALKQTAPLEGSEAAALPTPGDTLDNVAAAASSTAAPGPATRRPKRRMRTQTTQRRMQRTGNRKRAQTQDFTFRTGRGSSPWIGRGIFLVLGVALGGGVVYYLAWLGVMPGILY